MGKDQSLKKPHTCPYCDEEIAEASFPYCEACGLQVLSCPKCGMSVARERETCPSCGTNIKEAAKES